MDENTTQPVNPADDTQVNTPIDGGATEESKEEMPATTGDDADGTATEESAPQADSDGAAN